MTIRTVCSSLQHFTQTIIASGTLYTKTGTFWGRAPIQSLYTRKKLVVGYRRPKNLRDMLVNAGIPRLPEDDLTDPNHVPPATVVNDVGTMRPVIGRQSNITEFFRPAEAPIEGAPGEGGLSQTLSLPNLGNTRRLGTNPSKRGFKFCGMTPCRHCPKLNKTGHITSFTTGMEFNCMKNLSCRSSNLIYCLTCTRCGIQYVGQTLLRIRDRIGGHLCDTESGKLFTSGARHFSQRCHNIIDDIEKTFWNLFPRHPEAKQQAQYMTEWNVNG